MLKLNQIYYITINYKILLNEWTKYSNNAKNIKYNSHESYHMIFIIKEELLK